MKSFPNGTETAKHVGEGHRRKDQERLPGNGLRNLVLARPSLGRSPNPSGSADALFLLP